MRFPLAVPALSDAERIGVSLAALRLLWHPCQLLRSELDPCDLAMAAGLIRKGLACWHEIRDPYLGDVLDYELNRAPTRDLTCECRKPLHPGQLRLWEAV